MEPAEYKHVVLELIFLKFTSDKFEQHREKLLEFSEKYKNVSEFCYSANFGEVIAQDFSLVPSKWIEFVDRDSGIDFDAKMKRTQDEFKTQLIMKKLHRKNRLMHLKLEVIYWRVRIWKITEKLLFIKPMMVKPMLV